MGRSAVGAGLLAGFAGVAIMTAAEKIEQAVTGRPNSYVPARTLERLLGLPTKPENERLGLNWAMHWGQGVLLGAVRQQLERTAAVHARSRSSPDTSRTPRPPTEPATLIIPPTGGPS